MTLTVRCATREDAHWLAENDRHVNRAVIDAKIARGEILVAELDGASVGWLRWGYFWDLVPFMNLLHVAAELRGRSYGRALTLEWERRMQALGYDRVMTSTLADETSQHFYRKLGYRDTGSLLLPGEALEIIFMKELTTL